MTPSQTRTLSSSPMMRANPCGMAVLHGANPSAEGLRAEAGSVSAATPPADCAYLARAGGHFSFDGVAA